MGIYPTLYYIKGEVIKNTISIDKRVLDIAIRTQQKLDIDTDKYMFNNLNIANQNIRVYDKDILLEALSNQLNFSIDWEENLIITDKGYYNTQQYLILLLTNGRANMKNKSFKIL